MTGQDRSPWVIKLDSNGNITGFKFSLDKLLLINYPDTPPYPDESDLKKVQMKINEDRFCINFI